MAKLMSNRNIIDVSVTFNVLVEAETITKFFDSERIKSEITHWCKDIKTMGSSKGDSIGQHMLNGGQVYVYENSGKFHQLTTQKLQRGIQRWLQDLPDYFSSMVKDYGNCIAIDSDSIEAADTNMILQYAIYGKIVHK